MSIKSQLSELEEKFVTVETQSSQLSEWEERLAKFEQSQEHLNLVPELLSRLEKLEEDLRAKQNIVNSSNTPKSSSSNPEDIVKERQTMTYSDRELSLPEYELIEQYNKKKAQ